MSALLFLGSMALLGPSCTPQSALDKFFSQLQLNQNPAGVFSSVGHSRFNEHQQLKQGLIQSRMLTMLNEVGAAPKLRGKSLDVSGMEHFYRHEHPGVDLYYTTNKQGKLRYAILRFAAKVDARGDGKKKWSSGRLNKIYSAMNKFARNGLKPTQKDAYGNVFAWQGRRGKNHYFAKYLPGQDEFRVLLYP